MDLTLGLITDAPSLGKPTPGYNIPKIDNHTFPLFSIRNTTYQKSLLNNNQFFQVISIPNLALMIFDTVQYWAWLSGLLPSEINTYIICQKVFVLLVLGAHIPTVTASFFFFFVFEFSVINSQ